MGCLLARLFLLMKGLWAARLHIHTLYCVPVQANRFSSVYSKQGEMRHLLLSLWEMISFNILPLKLVVFFLNHILLAWNTSLMDAVAESGRRCWTEWLRFTASSILATSNAFQEIYFHIENCQSSPIYQLPGGA